MDWSYGHSHCFRHVTKTLRKDGLEFLVVIVPGSPNKPHFAGKAYVRVGPETREASAEQFDRLVAERTSAVRFLRGLIGQSIITRYVGQVAEGVMTDCAQYFITVRYVAATRSYPITQVNISFDAGSNRYLLEIG
jgi:hypothetical protein